MDGVEAGAGAVPAGGKGAAARAVSGRAAEDAGTVFELIQKTKQVEIVSQSQDADGDISMVRGNKGKRARND
jgi:phage terminase large subunit-like protein